MHPGVNGKKFPDKPAIVMAGSGKIMTHGELNDLSNLFNEKKEQLLNKLNKMKTETNANFVSNNNSYQHKK